MNRSIQCLSFGPSTATTGKNNDGFFGSPPHGRMNALVLDPCLGTHLPSSHINPFALFLEPCSSPRLRKAYIFLLTSAKAMDSLKGKVRQILGNQLMDIVRRNLEQIDIF